MDYSCAVDFEKRKIALLGAPGLCRQFYLQFCRVLDIKYVFTTSMDHGEFLADEFLRDQQEIACMPLKESLIRGQKVLLVLCAEHALRKPYDELLYLKGLEWGDFYIDYGYVLHNYRRRYGTDLTEKNIWIFGAGNNGRTFYETHKDTCQIQGFLSNYEEEKEYLGLPVIRPSEVLKQENLYIVICSDADAVMSEQLLELGLAGDRDFCLAGMIPRRLFIAMGTCQVIKVSETLNRNQAFSSRYCMDLYFDNLYEPCSHADDRRKKAYGEYCEVVFYNIANAGSEEFRDYGPIIGRFYQKALQIFQPFYYFRGQHPQATDHINPYAIRLKEGGWLWFRGDQEINRMLENHIPAEEIPDRVLRDDYWTEQEVLENFERELKKVAVLDRFSSFPIRPFIEENYQKITVFLDGTHFSIHLCLYLADKIAEYLGVMSSDSGEAKDGTEYAGTSVMPVYPCVRKALGMRAAGSSQFYNIESGAVEYTDTKGHIERYIKYAVRIREIREKYGTCMAW